MNRPEPRGVTILDLIYLMVGSAIALAMHIR
jgi:hypothetical protein